MMMYMEDGNEDQEQQRRQPTGFHWTMRLTAILLESFITDDGETMILAKLWSKKDNPFLPLKLFTSYVLFCRRAFQDGEPPEDCTMEEFERRLFEVLPPLVIEQEGQGEGQGQEDSNEMTAVAVATSYC